MCINNAINTDLKNMFAGLCEVFFVFCVFTNSIQFTTFSIILYHSYLNKRNKYFEKIFRWSLCLGFTS